MIQSPDVAEASWQDQLRAAVSPLDSGVALLEIRGYRPVPVGQESYRPRKTAAVLVPLLNLDQPEVVLTRRADHLPQHAGQVSFPGGAAEAGDPSAVHTALREAFEEIGLPREQTTPIGFLDRLDTISDYRVLPVVALVNPPVVWKPDQREVAEVFTVPLAFVINLEHYENRPVVRAGVEYSIWYLQYQRHTIWGATASMLLNLALRFKDAGNA
jgi:8-oxo-dGTP pyrophosphatase MutT (NUDIX family)